MGIHSHLEGSEHGVVDSCRGEVVPRELILVNFSEAAACLTTCMEEIKHCSRKRWLQMHHVAQHQPPGY